jgi:hypothetical protein
MFPGGGDDLVSRDERTPRGEASGFPLNRAPHLSWCRRESMSEQHYRVFHRTGIIFASELINSKFCHVRTSEPEHPDMPEGEWYCHNPDCVVRECTIRCKLFGEELPRMRCPACSSRMKFQHWIGHETLVPVRQEAGADPGAGATDFPDQAH